MDDTDNEVINSISDSDQNAHSLHISEVRPLSKSFKEVFQDFENSCISCFSILQNSQNINKNKANHERRISIWNTFESISKNFLESIDKLNIPEWEILKNRDKGHILRHTLGSLIALMLNPEYYNLSEYDKNLLLWAILFHDIGKRVSPEVYNRDPFHPFLSAKILLKVFVEFGWIKNIEYANKIAEIIGKSFVIKDMDEVIDHSYIKIILPLLWYCTRMVNVLHEEIQEYVNIEKITEIEDRFEYEILVLVLLHQSLEFNPQYPNRENITIDDIKNYLSPRIVYLSMILHKADHNSYNLGMIPYNLFPNDLYITRVCNEIIEILNANFYKND
ncbi:hypothetical protein SteCoe_1937 [Stentor coeruleus]|uniref:HD domain-containing protein n=1 Tax=Stentor coeruleus TaxID=5963 RepID=A0A1R2D0H1_9CILI|nr:hypothetical protein SteCoe_1937 [Stentor coeruleus]